MSKATRFGRTKIKRCIFCRGPHNSDHCTSVGKNAKKLYGTIDPETGEYVPPPGVYVRVFKIGPNVHSDKLTELMAKTPRQSRHKGRNMKRRHPATQEPPAA